MIKKGLVLVDTENPPKLTREFIVNLQLCNTDTDINVKGNYEPVVVSETFK